jgi:ribonuclease P protein subunit RPR2
MMPVVDGLELCRRLKADPETKGIPVVLLTGSEGGTRVEADSAGADAFVRKPFSPLELLAVVERLVGGLYGVPCRAEKSSDPHEQLELYARDLRHMLEVERGQRELLQEAYHETVVALTQALASKDHGTAQHSELVQHYALELARTYAPELAADRSLGYGFLLHDIGKIGIPDAVLRKPGSLTPSERRLIQNHTIHGEQTLRGIAILREEGIKVVRSHHERWDGKGYPDRLRGEEIPIGARIFAVADTLDAMTSDRWYRLAMSWEVAEQEILDQSARQFDPDVVDAFRASRLTLREICLEYSAA